MITHFIKIGKSIYKHFPLPTITIGVDGINLGLDIRAFLNNANIDEIAYMSPTRVGCILEDSKPFYESDSDKIWEYYFKYKNSSEHGDTLLYADFICLCSSHDPLVYYGLTSSPTDLSKIKIKLIAEPYLVPDLIAGYKDIAVDFFKDSGKILKREDKYENNASLRIDKLEKDEYGNILIYCRKATYFDQVGTNLIMDWKINKNNLTTTLREIESRSVEPGLLPSLQSSKLANTIGVAVMLFDNEGLPLLRVRSKNLASITEGKLHCSASGVLEYPNGTEPGEYDFSLINFGMIKEISDEIGLESSEYELYPVAFARELPRGGKPQFFYAAKTKLSVEEINKRIGLARESYEFSSSSLNSERWYEMSTLKGHYTYEGWACMRLAMQFARANNWINDVS